MSVLIKGMEMPKNCDECKIKSWDEGENDYVCPFSGVMTLSIDRQDDCPLEEQEPCEDAVSREAAIDAALRAFSRGLLASPDIRKLPSVTPERKKGKWTETEKDEYWGMWYRCSECGKTSIRGNFCPKCGAKMV